MLKLVQSLKVIGLWEFSNMPISYVCPFHTNNFGKDKEFFGSVTPFRCSSFCVYRIISCLFCNVYVLWYRDDAVDF